MNRQLSSVLALSTFILMGCNSAPLTTTPDQRHDGTSSVSLQAIQRFAPSNLERPLSASFPTARDRKQAFAFETGSTALVARSSERFPQLAGLGYGKDRTLQIYVTNEGNNVPLMRDLEARKEFQALKRESVKFVRVKHSFRKLGHIKQLLKAELAGISWSQLGYDFAGNVVTLAVTSPAEQEKAAQLLSQLRIADAVHLTVAPLAEGMADLGLTPGTITGTYQPTYLVAGLQTYNDRSKACTGGWSATVSRYDPGSGTTSLVQGFVTNSHCTIDLYASTPGDRQYHYSTLHEIGREYLDPAPLGQAYYACSGQTLKCRWSDSAFIQWTAEGLNHVTPEQTVVQTVYSNQNVGSLEIYDLEDTQVMGPGDAVQGDWISKIGRTTGWTYGTVLDTCTDIAVDSDQSGSADYVVLCSVKSDMGIAKGDSGGPAWTSNGSLGVNFAGGGGIAYSSPWQNINDDFMQDGLHSLYSY